MAGKKRKRGMMPKGVVSKRVIGKKGLGVGQVFIFIVAAITFALIMIFGYKAVNDFLSKGEKVEFIQFKTDLENSIKKIYTEYGAVRIEKYRTAAKYEQICFVDMDHQATAAEIQELCALDTAACTALEIAQEGGTDEAGNPVVGYDAVDENVFLKPAAPVKIKVFRLDVESNGKHHLCLPVSKGTFSLRLEGKGDRTALSQVE